MSQSLKVRYKSASGPIEEFSIQVEGGETKEEVLALLEKEIGHELSLTHLFQIDTAHQKNMIF